MGVEAIDDLSIEHSARGAIVETTDGVDTAVLVDGVREVVGSGPITVVHRGTVEEVSSILPAGVSSQITVSRDVDHTDVLNRVAEQLRAAIDARRDQSMLDALLSTFPMTVYVKDQLSRHLAVSDATLDQIGPPHIESPDGKRHHHPDDLLGKTDFDLYSVDIAGDAVEDDQTVIETEQPIEDRIETSYNKDGWRTIVSTTKAPWYDLNGDLRGIVGLTQDISQQKKYEFHLEQQNQRLRRLATMVSHDLRNPLSVAIGRLELARNTGDDEHFDAVETSLGRIEDLIEDVLFLTRQGIAVTNPQQISLQSLAQAVWDQMEHEGATLRTATEESIYCDPGRLRLLFENLFANAIEHGTSGDDPITITVGDLEDGGFFVEDDGIGIPPEERDTIFDPGLTEADSWGLGLQLVASIANAHAWTVQITHSAAGGTRFEFHRVRRVGGVR